MARRLRTARRFLEAQGCDRIALYLWRPKYVDALELVDHDVSIYHIVDEYSFSPDDPPTSAIEEHLIASVDHLIVHSPALLVKKGSSRPTEYIPNGVDYDSFADHRSEPDDLAEIPHPRIGYCGYLKHQMDWDLLSALIDQHPDYSWVFVGKVHHEDLLPLIHELDQRSNVFFLGPKSSHELAGYPQHFDVSIMPYVSDGYTKYIFPLKLHEYLAAGRPTIGTPIRSLADYDAVVQIADGVEEWSQALATALSEREASVERVAERQGVARGCDWNVLTERVEALLLSGTRPPENRA
jgi:glycosyltransferase involved in cell wall biosynthesis